MIQTSYSFYNSVVSSSNDACGNNDGAQPQEIFLYNLASDNLAIAFWELVVADVSFLSQ